MRGDKDWRNISRKLAGEQNTDEAAINRWLQKNHLNHNVLKRLIEIWEYNPSYKEDSSGVYKKLSQRIKNHEGKNRIDGFFYYAIRIAAILLLIFGTSVIVENYVSSDKHDNLIYHEVSVPKGNRSFIMLPDSSKVWITNNSTLRYPVKFSKKSRELNLTGEAYFEVVHNKKKPFIVNIGKNRIKVLGTKFSVSAYPEDEIVKADLVTGKIQFDIQSKAKSGNYKSFMVKPGHSLTYDKTTGTINESIIQRGFYDYWDNGVYSFRNESLESLVRRVERIYNIEIIFENDRLKMKQYSGSFCVDDNIFTFMEAIKTTSTEPIEYRFEKNKLYIKLKTN